jgi:hypothetical protein
MKISFALVAGLAAGVALAGPVACIVKDEIKIRKLEKADPVGRPMTPGEIAITSHEVFGNSIDYSKVRLHMTPYFGDPSVTVGNDIYMEGPSLRQEDFSKAPAGAQADLYHELEHVHQNQKDGFFRGLVTALRTVPGYLAYKLGGDMSVYDYRLSDKTPFSALNAEQQATMVQDYKLVRERFLAAGCASGAAAPVCSDLAPKLKLYEDKIARDLPLPGALTFKPGG